MWSLSLSLYYLGKPSLKKSSLNSANARKGGGQGPAQISWSTFDYSLLNLDNLKKGGGLGPAQILWSNLVLGF